MFDSVVLDIAIGLVFVFLATSLAITAGNELLASLFKWRAKDLATGLRMLTGCGKSDIVRAIYQHPLIRGLHRDEQATGGRKAPSYIPANLFAMALLDIALRPADKTRTLANMTIDEIRRTLETRRADLGDRVTDALQTFVNYAEADSRAALTALEKLQHDVEGWFNAGMDRVSGIYKRRAQLFSMILAVSFVSILNLDSIRITRSLSNDPVLRAALIERATATAKQEVATPPAPTPAPSEATMALSATAIALEKAQQDIATVTQLGIPLGWENNAPEPTLSWWISKIFGLLITALAASLGAPFWFDVLKKATSLRQPPPAQKPVK
ncbi:MAG TPA: hypothetical protein VIK91_16315 [Nannocystis sp.]